MKKISVFCLLAAVVLGSFSAGATTKKQQPLKVCKETGFEAKAISGSHFTEEEGTFHIVSKGTVSGVKFPTDMDLSAYGSVRFTFENKDAVHPMYVLCDMCDSRAETKNFTLRINRAKTGFFEGVYAVKPMEKVEITLNLPPDMPHPDVNEKFTLMRGTPYSLALGLYSYDIDLKDVRLLAIGVTKSNMDSEFAISDVEFIPGKRVAPKIMAMTADQFFPFVDKYGQYKHADWPGKIHSDKELAKAKAAEEKDLAKYPGPEDWDQWGGWKNGPRYEATGQFRVQKIDGKWWMIDPDGYLFWSHGVVRVTPSCCVTPLEGREDYFESLPTDASDPFYAFYSTHDDLLWPYYVARDKTKTYDYSCANAYRKYGEDYRNAWADMAHRRCRSWGINTMANSSDPAICAMDRTVYNERVDLGAPVEGYPTWPVLEGTGGWWPFIDPFDNSFPLCVRAHLEAKIKQIEDPWCLGFYVDNEIHWGNQTYFAGLALMASPTQASKMVLIDALARKYKTIDNLNKAWGTNLKDWNALLQNRSHIPSKANPDLEELTLLIVDKYFAVVREVFKQVAPDKLYMGCRFSSSPEYVVRTAAKYVDVMSYNNYTFDRSDFKLPDGLDLPVMLGEFHFGSMDRGMFHPGQVYTNDQEGKGAAYEYYLISCLKNPCLIGTNWHQFSDQPCTGRFDGEDFQVGFTDCCDTPYPETIKHVRAVGYNMYRIRMEK